MSCKDPKKPKKEQCNRKTNMLVYEKPAGTKVERNSQAECKNSSTLRPPICAPKPKHIRVCTGAEMKRMCPPKVCICPEPRKSRGIASLLKFGLKSAIAAAAIYVTYDMGIWGSTEETQDLYKFICGARTKPSPEKIYKWEPPSCEAEKDFFVVPRHDPYEHCEKPPVDMESSYQKFQSCWNKTVWTIFSGLANLPASLAGRGGAAKIAKEEEKEEEECIPYNKLDEAEQESVRVQNRYK